MHQRDRLGFQILEKSSPRCPQGEQVYAFPGPAEAVAAVASPVANSLEETVAAAHVITDAVPAEDAMTTVPQQELATPEGMHGELDAQGTTWLVLDTL